MTVRRSLVHYLPSPKKRSVASFAGKQHHHSCVDCGHRYVCACQTPAVDKRCNPCVSGIASFIKKAWAPQRCCVNEVREIRTAEEFDRYKLAGSCRWFICTTCARQFGYKPREEDL